MRTALYATVFGLLFSLDTGSTATAQSCNFVLRDPTLRPNDVVLLDGNRGAVRTLEMNPLRSTVSTVRLGYIVAPRDYTSGVLIVKLRHQPVAGTTFNSGRVNVRRQGYASPCPPASASRHTANYNSDYDMHAYVDYHRYGLRDPTPARNLNLNAFHADVGPRPARECVKTSDPAIRGHFLFSREVDERRMATRWQTFSRQASKLGEYLGATRALADPQDFAQYTAYRTTVIPYRKERGKPLCIRFEVTPIVNAGMTEVAIVDADDALAALPFFDPQQLRTIQWR